MRRVRSAAVVVLIGLSLALPTSAEPKTGVLCVIPDPPGCCNLVTVPFDLKTLMFRIDNGKKTPWPQKTGFKIEGLSLGEKHLVVVYSAGKPILSFPTPFHGQRNRALSTVRRVWRPGLEAYEQIVPLQVSVSSSIKIQFKTTIFHQFMETVGSRACKVDSET
jgi:hypothetical protein